MNKISCEIKKLLVLWPDPSLLYKKRVFKAFCNLQLPPHQLGCFSLCVMLCLLFLEKIVIGCWGSLLWSVLLWTAVFSGKIFHSFLAEIHCDRCVLLLYCEIRKKVAKSCDSDRKTINDILLSWLWKTFSDICCFRR